MAEGKIRVVMCPADRAPYITWISPTLQNMQSIVGGYIEAHRVATDAIVVCNEEGRIIGLPANKSFMLNGFVGDLFVAYPNGEEIDSLPVHTAQLILKMCKERWSENGNAL